MLYLWGNGQDERIPEPDSSRRQTRRGQDVRFKFLLLPQERFFGATDDLVEVLTSDAISGDIDILTSETAAHRNRSVIRLAAGLWNIRFWGTSELTADTTAKGQILRVTVDEDDAVLTTDISYGTLHTDTTTIGMVLEMEIEELELDGTEQLTFIASGVNGEGGDSWGCSLRLEKLT